MGEVYASHSPRRPTHPRISDLSGQIRTVCSRVGQEGMAWRSTPSWLTKTNSNNFMASHGQFDGLLRSHFDPTKAYKKKMKKY